ncbi:hypothetical protein QFZ75_000748 [Streptomyces sp. V3I8]|nr:hypothetical protein [Streptomyces sp. V3I8]
MWSGGVRPVAAPRRVPTREVRFREPPDAPVATTAFTVMSRPRAAAGPPAAPAGRRQGAADAGAVHGVERRRVEADDGCEDHPAGRVPTTASPSRASRRETARPDAARSAGDGSGPYGRVADPDFGPVDDPGLPACAEMIDDFGERKQPDVGGDGAAAHRRQRPYFADCARDGGPVDPEPAGQHVMGGAMAKVDESGEEPVDEHQLVFRCGAHGPATGTRRETGLVPLVPQRDYLGDEFSVHSGRQPRDPPASHDRCTYSVRPFLLVPGRGGGNMNADDHARPQWATTAPAELDRMALRVLRAARDAARELRQDPPDQARRTCALDLLAGQTQAMLGPDLPDCPPAGIAAQEIFVHSALALAVHARAHSWAEADLGADGVRGQDGIPRRGRGEGQRHLHRRYGA